jgi:SAM-dependent methyltransferase
MVRASDASVESRVSAALDLLAGRDAGRITACRVSGSTNLVPVLSLGETPLANSLRTRAELDLPEPRFPLELVFCPESALLQLSSSVPPEALFSDYVYFSSFSDGMLRSASALVERVTRESRLDGSNLVVEIASNDGYLLQYYTQRGIPVLGIEPAANIAIVAGQRGIPTRCEFFGLDAARRLVLEGIRADVVHANNVLAHVPDLNGFAAGLRLLLANDGIALIEVPYVKDMLDKGEFDTIYHEHLFYFSLTALARLFERHGLIVADVERLPIHGGSLRVSLAHASSRGSSSAAVASLLAEEAGWGVTTPAIYLAFAERVERIRRELRSLLARLKQEGRRIAAYGAAAKGSTLLNYCGIGHETLDYVVDRSTVKQGRYMPGARLLIQPPDRLLADPPDHVLLLAWNFAEEIMEQQAAYRRRGGRFILPVPAPHVV